MSERSPSRGRWLIAAILAVVAVCGYLGWRAYEGAAANTAKAQNAPPPAPIPVTVAAVRKADFPVYLNGLGVVEPYDTVTVSSRVDGEITKIDFRQGQIVKEGDMLAQIDPRPYQAALDQALAKKAADEAMLKNAQLNLQRYTTLNEKDFSSRQQVDTQQATVDQLIAQIKGDQAAIDNAQTQLSYTTIRSPLTGKTSFRLDRSRQHRPCEREHRNRNDRQAAADFGGVHRARGRRARHQQGARRGRRAGRRAEFGRADDALPWPSRSRQQRGRSGERRHPHEGDLRERRQRPLAGLSVSTRLLLDTLKDVIVVPVDAVQRGPNGLYAYVVGKDDKVTMRDIKVSQEGEQLSVVTQGLSPGENVVTEGQYRLREGALVQPTPAPTPTPTATGPPPDTISPAEAPEAAPAAPPLPAPAPLAAAAAPPPTPAGPRRSRQGALIMALNISAPFIRHPIATSLLMVGLLFIGIVAYPNLPVAPLPQVDFPTLQVSAQLPGASPETMASSVAQPLETQFAQISGVSQMTSVSTLGSTAITLAVRPRAAISTARRATCWRRSTPRAGNCRRICRPRRPSRKSTRQNSPILLLAATSKSLPLTEVDDNV